MSDYGFPVCPKCFSILFWNRTTQQWECDECEKSIANPAICAEDIVVGGKKEDENV